MWRHTRRLCLECAAALRSVFIIQHVFLFCKIVLRFFHAKNAFCLLTTIQARPHCALFTVYFTEKSCKAVEFLQINAEIHLFSSCAFCAPAHIKRHCYAILCDFKAMTITCGYYCHGRRFTRFEISAQESCILLSIKRESVPFTGRLIKKFAEPT